MMNPGHDSETHDAVSPSVALYVHVPFCQARCAYCDFNTYTGLEDLMPAYGRALCCEIGAAGRFWGRPPVNTLYVGGGTPSCLSLGLLSSLLDALRAAFDLSQCVEVTVEANPGTVDAAYLSRLRALGVDRLSIGVQSARDEELAMLGRIHSWADAVGTVAAARESGFQNLSLDLLFGLPGQSVDQWEETLERTLALHPEHLSLYALTVEEGTPLASRIACEELAAPDEDQAAAMYELAEQILADAGYFHYEISNWARMEGLARAVRTSWWPEGDETEAGPQKSEEISPYVCRHNLTYWRNQPWLGVGAGAYSWVTGDLLSCPSSASGSAAGGERWANVNHPADYVAGIARTYPSSVRRDVEEIERELEVGETMMLGLRLAEGVRAERFEARFGTTLEGAFGEELRDLCQLGLITWNGAVARLTQRGRLLGNRVFGQFI